MKETAKPTTGKSRHLVTLLSAFARGIFILSFRLPVRCSSPGRILPIGW